MAGRSTTKTRGAKLQASELCRMRVVSETLTAIAELKPLMSFQAEEMRCLADMLRVPYLLIMAATMGADFFALGDVVELERCVSKLGISIDDMREAV